MSRDLKSRLDRLSNVIKNTKEKNFTKEEEYIIILISALFRMQRESFNEERLERIKKLITIHNDMKNGNYIGFYEEFQRG